MISIQPVANLRYGKSTMKGLLARGSTYVSWFFSDSITDSLFKPLEVFVKEPLLFEQHGVDVGLEDGIEVLLEIGREFSYCSRGGRI